jgi:nucleotidyltransferase/DNA polymerase involved in DNA repair
VILFLRIVPGLSVALLERDRPELRSRPLVIGQSGGRGLVLEANTSAQRFGIQLGITLAQARHHCPDALVLMIDFTQCSAVWEEMCVILRSFTPLVQPLEPGTAVCDFSGCERHWGDAWSIARSVAGAIFEDTGIKPWIGIAANRLVAELASAVADTDGIAVVEEGEEQVFLADLPLTSLPEVDSNLTLTFQVLGLATAGQFAALPASSVKNRFGALGERLHRYARGIDSRPIVPPSLRPAISARYECEEGTPEEALDGLRKLALRVSSELQQKRLEGKVITVRLFWSTRTSNGMTQLPKNEARSLPGRATPLLSNGDENDRPPQNESLPPPGDALLSSGVKANIPIPYRIHSYALPQPNNDAGKPLSTKPTHFPSPRDESSLSTKRTHFPSSRDESSLSTKRTHLQPDTSTAMVRTPISAEAPLAERAQRLLLERLAKRKDERSPRLEALELEVSEFAQPEQIGFAELNRISDTGGLAGMSPERRSALLHGDEAWAARYGHTAFRHVASIDPTNVVTERRVRWAEGLKMARGRV